MALDHAHEGIRINAVCPGDTFVARWVDRDREKVNVTLTRSLSPSLFMLGLKRTRAHAGVRCSNRTRIRQR
jgi:NAD(P)-dependent dehydrogenase (short-subunit alcohol dehydrogenase family)